MLSRPNLRAFTARGAIPLALLALLAAVSDAAPRRPKADIPLPPPVPAHPEIHRPVQPRPYRYTAQVNQKDLYDLAQSHLTDSAFDFAFARGDRFFDNLFLYDATFGVGANVGQNQRFTRIPRMDLRLRGQWATHLPPRSTGPNAMSCIECHTQTEHDGSGFVSTNVIRDPLRTGNPASMIQRNTPHLFGAGAIQILAEEMTTDLQQIVAGAKEAACTGTTSSPVTRNLVAKGVDFGKITAKQVYSPELRTRICQINTSAVVGVDTDLVIRPFQWKGVVASLRDFNRGAAHNEMGLQAVELVGDNVDADGDSVQNELSVGDVTALTVYVAAQPRPTHRIELATLGWIPPLDPAEIEAIERGRRLFSDIGCAGCHTPRMTTVNSVFSEPSQVPQYRDTLFPSGKSPYLAYLDPERPVRIDLTRSLGVGLPFQKDSTGLMRLELYSDLKRHDLGSESAESIDEAKTGASTWITRPLWGVGSTAPYMHDGRATTFEEAIEFHAGEALNSRTYYRNLSAESKQDVGAFLNHLRLWKAPDTDSKKKRR